jgi:hypothetical protein
VRQRERERDAGVEREMEWEAGVERAGGGRLEWGEGRLGGRRAISKGGGEREKGESRNPKSLY